VMRFTVPFLLAIAVFTATVLGANQTSFTPNEDMLYDIVSASDAIAFRLERVLGIGEKPALIIGALLLTVPALLTFHLFRVGFGGAVQSIVEDRQAAAAAHAEQRAHAPAARRPASARPAPPQTGEVLSGGARAGDKARDVAAAAARGASQNGEDNRRGGLGANLAAAFSGRGSSANATSGTTSLSSTDAGERTGLTRGLRDRWGNLLDHRPDFSNLKSQAEGLRDKLKRSGKVASDLTRINKDHSSGQS
ncbi:MAG: hypothetical protein ACR2OX_09080, partial [Methyloligellaceae bacterium]